MLSKLLFVLFAMTFSNVCLAQKWEIGGTGGFSWYTNPSISDGGGLSAEAGFPPKGAFGVVFGNNMYEHVGGEIRYLFQLGGPQLRSDGTQVNMTGHTNLIVYDLLIHLTPRDNRLRPFFAGGAGIKVFSGTGDFVNNPLNNFVRLRSETEVEPAISAGGGVKYRITRHAQLRMDFRTYFSPLPRDIFRRTAGTNVHGWIYGFVPMVGVSYVF
jgi:hypothetical protein